jgi:hypothetical protein
MDRRRDALTAASRWCCSWSAIAEAALGLSAQWQDNVLPGAINVIPQDVEFTIDVRSGDDSLRRDASRPSSGHSRRSRIGAT